MKEPRQSTAFLRIKQPATKEIAGRGRGPRPGDAGELWHQGCMGSAEDRGATRRATLMRTIVPPVYSESMKRRRRLHEDRTSHFLQTQWVFANHVMCRTAMRTGDWPHAARWSRRRPIRRPYQKAKRTIPPAARRAPHPIPTPRRRPIAVPIRSRLRP